MVVERRGREGQRRIKVEKREGEKSKGSGWEEEVERGRE